MATNSQDFVLKQEWNKLLEVLSEELDLTLKLSEYSKGVF